MNAIDHDEKLAALLAVLQERRRRGQHVDLDALAIEHPEVGDELRALWATAEFASAFVRPVAAPPLPKFTDSTEPPPASLGDYEILQEIGRGGMGVVYQARQKSLGRLVAIKMMRDARLSSDSDRQRFRAEAAAAARLKHPNIITVHEVGEWDARPFMVMEHIAGGSLSQRLAAHGRPMPRDAARLVADIARGIQHAHEQGILHRDLKPSNILLERDPEQPLVSRPKVSDFGLAKRLAVEPASVNDARTHTGAIVGTPSYMAPEQATGRKNISAAADIWSLGAILYELLAGRPPFQAANPVDTLLLVIEQDPVPPRWFDPAIDRDLEVICLKCLQKPPNQRYASAADLAKDLEACLAGESLSSQPSGLRYFVSRMLRETHHAEVLENWGVLWMWHSLAVFVLCLLTQALAWGGVRDHLAYLALWSVGLIAWGTILWQLRRRAGPVLFVERQIAHAWAAGVCASIGMFVIEVLIPLPVLKLSPAIAIAAGMVFVFKAGILSGRFYITAAVMFLTAVAMPLLPEASILLFGIMSAACFFFPGLKYYRLRRRALATAL
jgi:serine/threonine-protein kinase